MAKDFALCYKNQLKNGLKYKVSTTFTKNINTITSLDGVIRGYANGRPTQTLGNSIDNTIFFAVDYAAGSFFLLENITPFIPSILIIKITIKIIPF